jgi:precorrin-6B methylase 2
MKVLRSVKELLPDPSAIPLPENLQGWHSDDPVFAKVIQRTKPSVIVQVGAWKGASTLHIARLAPEAIVIDVDTWLGSIEHMAREHDVPRQFGYPVLYHQYLKNIATKPEADRIFPLPQTSVAAARMIATMAVQIDLIYIDGTHEVNEVYADISAYWKLLRKGGVMFGDDAGGTHPGVLCDITRFATELGRRWESEGGFWVLEKL